MANETQIGQLVIDLKMRLEGVEKGLETTKKKLKEIESSNKEVENSNNSLESSYLAMSAVAIGSFAGIVRAIKDGIEEYKAYTQAMSSLQNVSEYTGESMNDLSSIMQKYEGIMTKSDLATTIKNFTLMGYAAKDTDKMIESLTNSAIRNRNANYTVSEAVRVASEGYRQGLSTLSDSAGVTENLSVMLDNYARSIGKTASQLTEAEKNQAYLNRTMYAAEPFAGAMEDYLDSLAGKQGEYSQAMRETQVAFTESIEPILKKITQLGTNSLNTMKEFIEKNQGITSGVVAFGVALTGAIVIIKAAKVAMTALNTAMFSNPITLVISLLATLIGICTSVVSALNQQKEKQEELRLEQEEYNAVLNDTIQLEDDRINKINSTAESINTYLDKLKEKREIEQAQATAQFVLDTTKPGDDATEQQKKQYENLKEVQKELAAQARVLSSELGEQSEKFKKKFSIEKNGLLTEEDLIDVQKAYNKQVEKGKTIQNIKNAMDITNVKNQQREAAQLKINVAENQRLLNLYKSSKKGSDDYNTSLQALIKAYPECVTAQGLATDSVQNFISAEQAKADQSWNTTQALIQNYASQIQMALNDEQVQKQICANLGQDWSVLEGQLRSVLGVLTALAGVTPEKVQGITLPSTSPVTKKASGSKKAYENKALDNYKKDIEYKKSLDQISLRQEISMYETALRKYAKTTDEKRELRTKIYELNKELARKEKDVLEQQTEDYEAYIQKQKNLRGAAYDVTEQTSDYNKIIQMHKNYLNQIMKDERLSLDERKEIYREELQTIRGYEQQKRDLRVEQIDNTVSQLTNAITKQLEEMHKKDKEMIDKNIEQVEKWKEARINAINEEYDARIEAIEKELQALDKAEQQKSRDEEDAEYEKKKLRLEELVAFEHDATTKANYQKELDKLIAEYQKTLDKRALEDKKEALNEQKELLQEEQDNRVQAIEDEADRQKEIYDKQLEDLEEYYDKQIEIAQETAEKMLLNVEQNQNTILNLLKSYGNAYEITGQSLGEKLAQGINEGIANKIENIIQRVQDTIDAGIENKLSEIAGSVYRYEAGANKPSGVINNIVQNNYIEQNPELPSEAFRKLNNVSQNLAAEIRGM
ncbi:MAG: hypothetical protein HFJ20_03020 [Clostridia bacterium]|nr:hypothetical protein [Clostridia bacterium]